MVRDKAGIEAREQRLYEELAWAQENGSEKTIAAAQRRYDAFLRRHNQRSW